MGQSDEEEQDKEQSRAASTQIGEHIPRRGVYSCIYALTIPKIGTRNFNSRGEYMGGLCGM